MVRAIRGAHELTLHAENLRLRGDSPKQALEHLGSLIQRSSALPFERLNLAATACQLDLGSESLTFSVQGVAGEFVADGARPTLRVAYRLAETGVGTHCELMVSRDRSADPVRTSIELKTLEGVPLPGRVLDVFFDTARWLGPPHRVEGTLLLDQTGTRDWEGQFTGNLLDVDLATLVGEKFPRHHLAGLARVAVKQARWGDRSGQGPGWINARGALIASQGIIGVDLVNALAPRDEVPAVAANGEGGLEEDRPRFPVARCCIRHAGRWRNPPGRCPGTGVHARNRARECERAAGLRSHRRGERPWADQNPLPRCRFSARRAGSAHLPIARAPLPASRARGRQEDRPRPGGKLNASSTARMLW